MLSDKFVKKYLRLARHIAEDNDACYSRKIGVVIVHPTQNRLLSMGYNGPPRGVPHADSYEHLSEVLWPSLSDCDKVNLERVAIGDGESPKDAVAVVCGALVGCKQCPRRILNIPSGQMLHWCPCEHGERNAVYNASCDLHGTWMICWCGVPCRDCCKAIINSGISRVVCLANDDGKDYSPDSRWMLGKAGVRIELRHKETLDLVEVI